MKIAISATRPSLDAEVDPGFGRCQYFIIVDPQTLEFEAVENTNGTASVPVAGRRLPIRQGLHVII